MNTRHRGDPLAEMIAELPVDDLDRLANSIASAHRIAAGRALDRNDQRAVKFHQLCASDVLRRLREADS